MGGQTPGGTTLGWGGEGEHRWKMEGGVGLQWWGRVEKEGEWEASVSTKQLNLRKEDRQR